MSNRALKIPKYVEIYEDIRKDILAGKTPANTQIPTVIQLMEDYEVSKITVVRALMELEDAGLIRKEQGRGCFVNDIQSTASTDTGSEQVSVAVLVPDIANPFFSEILSGIEKTLKKSGYFVSLNCYDYDHKRLTHALSVFDSNSSIKGFIVFHVPDLETGCSIEAITRPVVFVDGCPSHLRGRVSVVENDHNRGGYIAAMHLIELGHRQIGAIYRNDTAPDRIHGFKQAIEESHLPVHLINLSPKWNVDERVCQFVSENCLTGLMVANDMLAIACCRLLVQSGLRVPDNVSIVGYDNIEMSGHLEVPLTTVDQREDRIGVRSAEILLNLMNAPAGVERIYEVIQEPILIRRSSTRTAPTQTSG